MQLAATQIEKWELVVQCSVCEEIRRSAVRAEAPPCGGSQNSLRWLRHENNNSADRSRACELKQRALFLNRANAACVWGGAVIAEVTIHRAERLRLAQRCELQKTISPKNDCKQRKPTNCKNRRTTKNGDRTTVRKQLFLINPPAPLRRQRTAESTNHTDKSRNPCHSGCEVAGSEDSARREHCQIPVGKHTLSG